MAQAQSASFPPIAASKCHHGFISPVSDHGVQTSQRLISVGLHSFRSFRPFWVRHYLKGKLQFSQVRYLCSMYAICSRMLDRATAVPSASRRWVEPGIRDLRRFCSTYRGRSALLTRGEREKLETPGSSARIVYPLVYHCFVKVYHGLPQSPFDGRRLVYPIFRHTQLTFCTWLFSGLSQLRMQPLNAQDIHSRSLFLFCERFSFSFFGVPIPLKHHFIYIVDQLIFGCTPYCHVLDLVGKFGFLDLSLRLGRSWLIYMVDNCINFVSLRSVLHLYVRSFVSAKSRCSEFHLADSDVAERSSRSQKAKLLRQ